MAVQTLSLAPYQTTNAEFRAWGSGIAAGIVAAGLVKTTDTGQIDWTTVLTPTVANTKRGYEIYRFNDALQATRPVFMRFDYGSGAYVYNPMIWVTVGTATDGAGTITAHASFPNTVAGIRTSLYNTSSQYFTSLPSLVYVDSDEAGSLMVAGWFSASGASNPTYCGFVTVVERTRDFDGTKNGEGVLVLTGNIGGCLTQTIILTNAPSYSTQPGAFNGTFSFYPWPSVPIPNVGWAAGVQYFYPVFTGFTPQMHGPSKHVISMLTSDMPTLTQFDLNHYGALKRWVVTNSIGFDVQNTGRACVRIT